MELLGKTVSGIMVTLLLIGMLTFAFHVQPVRASGTIYIKADGSVIPQDAPISSVDNVTYTFTGNINDSIVVERDNIIIDGAGYTVQGTGAYESKGIDLSGKENVTIRNMETRAFYYGIYLSESSNNSVVGNNITNNSYGIYLQDTSNNNSVKGNNITNNYDGIYLGNSSINTISGNNITNNEYGIYLYHSSNNNIISGNNITANNDGGILLSDYSSGNTISGNLFTNNGLYVLESYGNFVEDNFVNGKPLVYLEGVSHQTVGEAGQVILVNCGHIQVENLNLSDTTVGIQLWKTNNTIILGNNITNSGWYGIKLDYSSNNTITNNAVTNNRLSGIYLYESSNNSISGNNITANNYGGIYIWYSSINTISGNNITNHGSGIHLWGSSNNTILRNNVTNNMDGIWLGQSSNYNSLTGNDITNNQYGIYFYYSSNNFITGNNIANNGDDGIALYSSNYNKISGNNMTANKRYGIVLEDSSNNGIVGNNIKNSTYGIALRYSSNYNSMVGNDIKNNRYGIWLFSSSSNSISGNNVTANGDHGICLESSSNYNSIVGNNMTANKRYGIWLEGLNNTIIGNTVANNRECGIWLSSNNTTIYGNNIKNNTYGTGLSRSSNNRIYHNNFIDNTYQVYSYYSVNVWDNGYPSGGNYWTDYNGTDLLSGSNQNVTGSDGIGDSPNFIDGDNQDLYPLMGPINVFDAGVWDGKAYSVHVISNSTVSTFQLDVAKKTVSFNVTGMEDAAGFCRITIPNIIVQEFWHGNYTVLLNDEPYPFRNWTDTENTYLYVNYTHSEHEITIIPEFPSAMILPLFMVPTTLAVVFTKKRLPRKPKT